MLLPWGVFAFGYTAFYVRVIRSTVRSTLSEDYVRTARAKGAPERVVLRSHVLRNAVLPIVTMFGMDVALALGGAVIIELVFSLPGLGYVAIKSLGQFDYAVTLGVVVFATHRGDHRELHHRSPVRVHRPADQTHVIPGPIGVR